MPEHPAAGLVALVRPRPAPRSRCTEELLSRVAASRGCCRCLELLLEKGGDPEPRDQHGERDGDVVLGRVLILRDLAHAWGWPPAEDPGGPWRSLSFLTEDGTQGSVCPGDGAEGGLLSSTRRSLLEELELGGGCSSGEPLHWWGCPPEPPSLSIPSVAPRPPADPGGSALPPQPLASSTLLSAGDELGEGPQTARGSTGGPPGGVPEPSAGDSPGPSPQQEFGPGGSPSSPQPRCYSRVPGARGVSPRAPLLRGGLSNCSVACQSPGDSDVLGAAAQHRPGVPQGPPVGWAGLGGDIPNLGTTVLEVGAGGCDRSSLGDSSGASERFVSAVETLEPSEAGGCPGAQHRRSPQPRAAGGLEPGRAPSPAGAAAWELPPASPPNTGQVQGEDFWGGSRAAPCCEDGSDVGDGGELLSRLQACSLRGSPPCTPGPLCSPASLAAGGVAPQGQEPPRYHHVTPRTKSRLQASAARLSASSSSSLFDETLEMPRRPPRLRAPRGVSRDPATTLGHCITLGAKDVSGGAREGTASLDDTEIFPRAPSQPSSPLGTSSSPGSSPTVLLVPGDHGHPQDSPLGAQGSPCAAGSPNPRVLEGCSGWQDPSPLGTRQPPWPHGSFSRPPVPRQLGSAMAEPGSPAVPLSPAGRSTHRHAGEHLEEGERGRAPTERHGPGTEATTSPEDAAIQDGRACTAPPRPVSDEALRRRLRALGDDPGPVTELTRRLYLRRLEELVRGPRGRSAGHSPELAAALRTGHVPDCAQDELALARQFDRPDRSRRWREGLVKSSFNYLLLDPRTTQNLPLRSHRLSPAKCFRTFVKAIFYVGKGTRARPYCHLAEALSQHRAGTQKGCPKVRRILEIWASGQGVISVHCFQSTVPAEAYTREGCLVEALGLQTITNQRKGNCYGVAASWPAERRRRLGVHMLHRAMRIFLAEGERQLRPADIQGGR
ncbi:ankyrin repeat and LEM domain-containing protein 1 isoform X4 [Grus americana]|uniref:ankyrin repeat and LEM domain-containing protein 1 isoform X4 n=1 Tax=Grus americana TaxID=9117 RepID=UPI002407EDCE|nr:ankyrin repeat and LEM domain-containing protein 1 isoform X4 [Grus americana]